MFIGVPSVDMLKKIVKIYDYFFVDFSMGVMPTILHKMWERV